LFNNDFSDLSCEEVVALLSCLVFDDRHAEQPPLNDRLSLCVERIESVCERIVTVLNRCGFPPVTVDEYFSFHVNPGLMCVVYAWAQQVPFVHVCSLTNVLEGSIVRTITRLEEACKELRNASRVIGDRQLYEKMQRASELIRR
jgi:antiviral helicase SKI2